MYLKELKGKSLQEGANYSLPYMLVAFEQVLETLQRRSSHKYLCHLTI